MLYKRRNIGVKDIQSLLILKVKSPVVLRKIHQSKPVSLYNIDIKSLSVLYKRIKFPFHRALSLKLDGIWNLFHSAQSTEPLNKYMIGIVRFESKQNFINTTSQALQWVLFQPSLSRASNFKDVSESNLSTTWIYIWECGLSAAYKSGLSTLPTMRFFHMII